RLGAGARVVVEDDRRLAPLVVLVLAHQQHSAPRARAPVDAARIVAFTKSAQPRQLALPAGSLVAPRRRRRGERAQDAGGERGQRGVDDHLLRVGHLARARHQPERELGGQPEARQLVAPAPADDVAVGGFLAAPGRQLQEVTALFEGAPFDEILDLDGERREPPLLVLERDPHQVRRPRMDRGGQDPLHAEPREPQRREEPVGHQQAGHHPERQEEEVDPGVDRHRADEQGDQEKPPPLARGGQSASQSHAETLRGFPHPPAKDSAEQSSAPSARISRARGGDRGSRRGPARRPAATAPPPPPAIRESPDAPAPATPWPSDRRGARTRALRPAPPRARRSARRGRRAARPRWPGGANAASRAPPRRRSRPARARSEPARRRPATAARRRRSAPPRGAGGRPPAAPGTRGGCAARPRAPGSRSATSAGSGPSATRGADRCRSAPPSSGWPSPGTALPAETSARRSTPGRRSSPRATRSACAAASG